MYVCKYMCVCIWIYMYVNFFCFVLFSFIRGKGGRQLRPSLSGTVGGVTSPYTNTPFLEKNYMGKKKWKKTIQAHAVRLAIPGKLYVNMCVCVCMLYEAREGGSYAHHFQVQ